MTGEKPAAPRRIQVLPPDVSNKIAAGEVVERPASVVKELVENAVDAGARSIRIDVKGGGKELIRVRDDGCGVDPEDALLAFERHATSKIRSAEDLNAIQTLGFRGEALASIASVAVVEFISRTAGSEAGVQVLVEGGKARVLPWGAPVGTQVTVRDLFYNTPARFKFLKSDATERRYIAEYVTHMALARPKIRFELTLEGQTVLHSPGNGALREAIAAVHGKRILPDLVPVEWVSPWGTIHGYAGTPKVAKGDRSAQSIFVNGRWIQSRLLSAAVERGYESLLAHRRFPLVVLHIEIDPTLIDVNVHPAKTEIRFRDERETFKAVMLAVRKALTGADLVPSERGGDEAGEPRPGRIVEMSVLPFDRRPAADPPVTARPVWTGEARGVYEVEQLGPLAAKPQVEPPFVDALGEDPLPAGPPPAPSSSPLAPTGPAPAAAGEPDELINLAAPAKAAHAGERLALHDAEKARAERIAACERAGIDPRNMLRTARVLGQIALTYLLVPTPTGLWVIDQHVAHERILYERVLRAKRSARPAVQELLVPHPLSLSPRLAAAVEELQGELEGLGFVVERFGPRDYALRAVPAALARGAGAQFEALLEELIGVMQEGGPTALERSAATIACRAAVKAGDPLTNDAAERLVRELADVENPFACPHGRPVIIEISERELERRFGRS